MDRRAFLTLIAAMAPVRALAHAPSEHEFDMVAFEPPFPAPNIALKDLDGVDQRVGEGQERKFILLNFWATWCPPCVREMPSLQTLQDLMDPAIFQVLALSTDRPAEAMKVRRFVKKLELSYTIVHDLENTASEAYGATELPSTYLIDPDGNIVSAAKGERVWHNDIAIAYFKDMIAHRA